MSLTRRHLDSLLDDTNSNLKLLSDLTASFRAVEAQTSSFQARSHGLLEEQQRVSRIAQDVGDNLRYYNLLDPLTRRLNAPGAGNSVRSQDFPQMLANLDDCLDFMHAHVSVVLQIFVRSHSIDYGNSLSIRKLQST